MLQSSPQASPAQSHNPPCAVEPPGFGRLRILEIITVPFFAPRGTGFSSYDRTAAFSRMGHQVDVLAYHLGEAIDLPGVRVSRTPRIPLIRGLKMGPSVPKLFLDGLLALKTGWRLLSGGRYDLVHVHEEASFWIALLWPLYRGPVLYDMHSSLVEQLGNFGRWGFGWARRLVAMLERLALRRATVVIAICPELADYVQRVAPETNVFLIENLAADWSLPAPTADGVDALRNQLKLVGQRVVLYTGTLGANQGIDLLLDSVAEVRATHSDVRLLIVGGTSADLDRTQAEIERRGLTGVVITTGQQPYETMPSFYALADVLVSPRTEGTNTPLKIYSYLNTGKPIVATRLLTHTQVLCDETAELVETDAAAFAAGIVRLLDDPERAREISQAARELGEHRYGIERYERQVREVIQALCPHAAVRAV